MRRQWRQTALLSESLRNVWANQARSLALLALMAGVLIAVGLAEASAVAANLDLVRSIEDGGGNVLVATERDTSARSYGGIATTRCRSLSTASAVVGGGPSGEAEARQIGLRSVAPLSVILLEPGALAAMIPHHDRTQIFDVAVPREIADSLGLEPGSLLQFDAISGVAYIGEVTAVVDVGVRAPTRATTIFEVAWLGEDTATECIFETTWEANLTLRSAAAPILALPGQAVQVVPLNSGGFFDRDPRAEFESRATRHAWVACAVLAGIVFFLIGLARRSEVGLYRSLHVGRVGVLLIFTVEAAILATAAALLATLIIIVVGLRIGQAPLASAYGLRAIATGSSAATTVALLMSYLASWGSTADQLKE